MNKTRIAQLRKDAHLTQEELAEKSYLTVRTIQRIEAGEDISLNSLNAIANALSVPISSLFESIAKESQEEEIMQFSQAQVKQSQQRRAESTILSICFVAINFFILSSAGFWISLRDQEWQNLLWLIWVSLLLLMLAASLYIYRIKCMNRLDKKYPKTVGDYKYKKIKNGWDFLARYWWIIFPIGAFWNWLVHNL